MNCKTCKFFYSFGKVLGECRAHPPSFESPHVNDWNTNDKRGYWPDVLENEWCGEYKEKVANEEK